MAEYRLPIGMDSFRKIKEQGYYYIDKTGFISELMQKPFEVNLITRPRRFGKTLTMSMLAEFFDIRRESKAIFQGLGISDDKAVCKEYMNQWPVLYLTLKGIEGLRFESAYGQLKEVLYFLFRKHTYLLSSEKVSEFDKTVFQRLILKEGTDEEIKNSLKTIMGMMYDYYEKPVILLMDEYDVPLAKANENEYYIEMLDVIRSFLGNTLKTNEYFGFTNNEVEALLKDFGMTEHVGEAKDWYDGYHFGSNDVYCPWDVINYVNALQDDPSVEPQDYWKNTSGNAIVRQFIDQADEEIVEKFETLIGGGYICQKIVEDLTYDTLHSTVDNLWSVLLLTGYLTRVRMEGLQESISLERGEVLLQIPNKQVKELFTDTIKIWFEDKVTTIDRSSMFHALWNDEAEKFEMQLSNMLMDTISYHDYKENFYHAFLVGLLSGAGYSVKSNYEMGLGRSDVAVHDRKGKRALIIEAKHSKGYVTMSADCDIALKQVENKRYLWPFLERCTDVKAYGIAFYEKECKVKIRT